MTNSTPRWEYRFDNFGRAYVRLRQLVEVGHERQLTEVEKEATIQRFEYSWELAWKVLKDYLQASGVAFKTITPASVIKAAFQAGLIDNGEDWMDALDARNKMSHVYDLEVFEKVVADVSLRFLGLFEALYFRLMEEKLASE